MRLCRCSCIKLLQMIIYLKIYRHQSISPSMRQTKYEVLSVWVAQICIYTFISISVSQEHKKCNYNLCHLFNNTRHKNKPSTTTKFIQVFYFFFFMYHNRMSLIEILSASQAPYVNQYKNATGRILNRNGNIFFNQECIKRNITSQYAEIKRSPLYLSGHKIYIHKVTKNGH